MKRRYMAAVAAAAISCGLMPAAASAKLKIGVTDATMQNRDPVQFWDNVNALHLNVIRSQIGWHTIAAHKPKNPTDPNDPRYNWKLLDKNVRDGSAWAEKVKGTVIYNVWGTAKWAHQYKRGVAYVPVPKTADFRNFMKALAKRYSGTFIPAGSPAGTKPLPRITHWEIWNEPNNALGLAKPSTSKKAGVPAGAKAYRTILQVAYTEIHRQDQAGKPRAVVIGGAVGGRTGVDHVTFYKQLKSLKAPMDAISVHPYSIVPAWGPSDGAPGKGYLQPFYRLGNFNRFISFVKGWKGSKFPIWVTEIGWQVNPPEKRLGVPSSKQTLFYKQTVTKLRKYPQVQGMTWYMLRDEVNPAGWQSGFLTYPKSHKSKKRQIWFAVRDTKK
jgi:Glycosyl hydrolase catalytic core